METRLSAHANRPKKPIPRTQPAVYLLAIALVLLAMSSMAGCAWLGVQLIVRPQSLSWINRLLPGWIPTSSLQTPPQTLSQIRADLRRTGTTSGELIPLGKSPSLTDSQSRAQDWLLPIYQPSDQRSTEDTPIVELRVYQSADQTRADPMTDGKPSYRLVTQLAIAGLEESFVVAPLTDANSPSQGSSRPFPVTHLSRFEGTLPRQGIWLKLSGQRNWGSDTLAYGYILYYNPSHQHLSSKLQWTSPTGEEPVWKEVAGRGDPELIVNQTVGMEPDFQIYQVKSVNFVPSPVQLQAISVAEPALDQPTYQSALVLARGRLWSTSLKWLESFKAQLPPQQWNREVQSQLELIRWHAQATAAQADSSWASPSQQALANLIDGRWQRALTVLETSDEASQEMAGLLKTDTGRLSSRMKSALQVGTDDPALKIWMGLSIAAQAGNPAAIAWLKKQPKTTAVELKTLDTLMQRMTR